MSDEAEPEDSDLIDLTNQPEGEDWTDQDAPTYRELPGTEEILDQLSEDELKMLRDKIDERLDEE